MKRIFICVLLTFILVRCDCGSGPSTTPSGPAVPEPTPGHPVLTFASAVKQVQPGSKVTLVATWRSLEFPTATFTLTKPSDFPSNVAIAQAAIPNGTQFTFPAPTPAECFNPSMTFSIAAKAGTQSLNSTATINIFTPWCNFTTYPTGLLGGNINKAAYNPARGTWFASDQVSGLIWQRADGTWQAFPWADVNPTIFSSGSPALNVFTFSPNGDLWIARQGSTYGLLRLPAGQDPAAGKFQAIEALNSDEVLSIAFGTSSIDVGTKNGVVTLQQDLTQQGERLLPAQWISAIAIDLVSGKEWFGVSESVYLGVGLAGVYLKNLKDPSQPPIPFGPENWGGVSVGFTQNNTAITSGIAGFSSDVWIGLQGGSSQAIYGGVVHFDGAVWTRFAAKNGTVLARGLSDIKALIKASNKIWVATANELSVFDGSKAPGSDGVGQWSCYSAQNTTVYITNAPSNPNSVNQPIPCSGTQDMGGLGGAGINDMAYDEVNNILWLATPYGVVRVWVANVPF